MAATVVLDLLELNVTEQLKIFWVSQGHPRNNKILVEMSDLHLLEISLLVNCLIQNLNQSFHLNRPRVNLFPIWQQQDSELSPPELPQGLPLLQYNPHNNLLPDSINSNSNRPVDNNLQYNNNNNPERLPHLSNNLDVLALNKLPDKLSLVNKHLLLEILILECPGQDNLLFLNSPEDKVDSPVNNLISSKMV